MSVNEIEITIIVNGQPVPIKINVSELIRVAVKEALERSENTGQPYENWELRDASGQIIDFDKKIGNLDIKEGTKLFLNLKAGVGGN